MLSNQKYKFYIPDDQNKIYTSFQLNLICVELKKKKMKCI